jgi:hypothetical protein
MSPTTRDVKKHVKARQRRHLKALERLERDRHQAQQAAEALEQALHDLGLPKDLVVEIEGRLRSQKKLLGKILGVMCPPLFGCRTNSELCRVRSCTSTLRLIRLPPKPDNMPPSSKPWQCVLPAEYPPSASCQMPSANHFVRACLT